jgi:hypothetical protein
MTAEIDKEVEELLESEEGREVFSRLLGNCEIVRARGRLTEDERLAMGFGMLDDDG